MNSPARIAADILIATLTATQDRIMNVDAKQASEIAEAFKIIHEAVDACMNPPQKQ